MLVVISPAKSLNEKTPVSISNTTEIAFSKEAKTLIGIMKKKSIADIMELMDISEKLAQLNAERYSLYGTKTGVNTTKPAMYLFDGDVYDGLDAYSMNKKTVEKAQEKIRILSGLYGVLKPLDIIHPYRLEMGISLETSVGKNLYAFWGEKPTQFLNKELSTHKTKTLINLASTEYFSVIKPKQLQAEIITPIFKEKKGNIYKVISFTAKKARGLMARFIVENNIDKPKDIQAFKTDGYKFNAAMSSEKEWVFVR